ncbi:MAG: proton-conducting membrane transporter [Oscillospiraceae bacterium]|nr:proton-conducting membrane transporter [Oscillospiraceae bacterium]
MSQYWIIAAIALPILGAAAIPLLPFRSRREMLWYIEAIVLITSAIVGALLLGGKTEVFHVVHFVRDLSISFKIDGLSMVFAGLVAILWPLAALYAFEYMTHEKNEKRFFLFYTMTYGVTLGIAFASDMVTMYFFYELLTLVTVPLVMHTQTREAILAVRRYLYYSIGGAAFAMMGMIFVIVYGNTCEFQLGGVFSSVGILRHGDMLLWIYFFSFMGFGVKAAVWPMSSWLPQAGVAPTPVTALLHAVAVVNAGAFAIIRLTYYSFGTEFLRGTWVQNAAMAIALFTVVYGCSRAVKETHIKRRLAWSTVSNLSYILFGTLVMTPMGLVGALTHFVFHGFMKITSFFCAGAFMHQTGKKYVYEMDGVGRSMKITFGCFAVSALGLMGVPGFAGFVSKWNLTAAAVESDNVLVWVGVACLLVSALLTAIYMLGVVRRAFFPSWQDQTPEAEADPGWQMCLPLLVGAAFTVVLGLCSRPLVEFFQAVAGGMI